jgi:hypothetical protein
MLAGGKEVKDLAGSGELKVSARSAQLLEGGRPMSNYTPTGKDWTPLLSEFKERLRRKVVAGEPWERATAGRLLRAERGSDIVAALRSDDPNTRIVAARVIGTCAHLNTWWGIRPLVAEELRQLSQDQATNQYAYGSFQCEESSPPVVVSDEATEALARLTGASAIKGTRG